MGPAEIRELAAIVRTVAREELLPRFRRVAHQRKTDGSLLTEADLAVDARLRTELALHAPETAFLSEEMDPVVQEALLRDTSRPLWCLDPLDGTSNFAAGIPFFCVSLALLSGARVEFGIVYDPVRDECFTASRNLGAELNGNLLHTGSVTPALHDAVALIDLKRLTPDLRARLIERPPYHSQRNFGACALEWAWLAAGRGHVYLHGGQKLWDLAAGCLLLGEAGGASSDLHGDPVFRPGLAPRPVVAAVSPDLARDWLAHLQGED